MKTKYFKFISVFVAVLISFSCFSLTVFASIGSPYVSGSSIDYGFINYSVPYLEKTNGQIYGYAREFSPFFYQFGDTLDNVTDTTDNYYSYCASAILFPDLEQKLINNTSYYAVFSLSFSKPVYKATFKLYLGEGAAFASNPVTFRSFGGDTLDPWYQAKEIRYCYVSIYNIENPVKLFYVFKIGNGDLSSIGINISLSELIYADGSAEQISNDNANTNKIISNQDSNADKITANNNANTDKILNAGSDTTQPDFAGTNGQLDSTTAQMDAIEGQYKIDQQSTTAELNKGSSFLSGTNMNNASIKVKSWIERFASENTVISGFLVAALCLGLCFWVIGRKAASG